MQSLIYMIYIYMRPIWHKLKVYPEIYTSRDGIVVVTSHLTCSMKSWTLHVYVSNTFDIVYNVSESGHYAYFSFVYFCSIL